MINNKNRGDVVPLIQPGTARPNLYNFLFIILSIYFLLYNLYNPISDYNMELSSLLASNYFIKKDSIKNINLTDDKMMQGILHQDNLLVPLDINSNISKAVSLANHIHMNIPQDNLVKLFVDKTINNKAKVVANIIGNKIISNVIIDLIDKKPNQKISNSAGYMYSQKLVQINNILVLL